MKSHELSQHYHIEGFKEVLNLTLIMPKDSSKNVIFPVCALIECSRIRYIFGIKTIQSFNSNLFVYNIDIVRPEWKNSHRLSEKLASLRIMRLLNPIVL